MSTTGPETAPDTAPDDVLLTRGLLRRAALRAGLLSAGLALSVWVLIIVPEGRYASAPTLLLLHAALTGLVGFPLTIFEVAVARRRDQGALLHLAAAAVVGLAALVGSSLAWSQARYTEAALRRGSIEDGMTATQGGGPITRRPVVATTIFVAPPTALALAALLALRRARPLERLVTAPIAGLLLSAGFLGAAGIPLRGWADHHLHLLAFAGAVAGVAVLSALIGDALNARLSG